MSPAANESDDTSIGDKRICSDCIEEEYLQAKIEKTREKAKCDYCGTRGKTVSIGDLADDVQGAFRRHYYRTPVDASDFEYLMMKETDYEWEREGQPAVYAIQEAVHIPHDAAEDVRQLLEGRNYDMDDAAMRVESEFDSDSHYEEGTADTSELHESWQRFRTSLKTEARLFNRAAEAMLDSIFDGLDAHATRDRKKVIVDAGPGKQISALYRARVFQSDEKLEQALKRPDRELGPPPPVAASAGRMNSRGIAVFYGATSAVVALAETRPPVGSRVLVGRFGISRPLRLLDVEALRSIYVTGSIFDPEHLERLKKAKFLASLSHQITQPVMPDDEPFEYLVTQAIADYLANRTVPPVDGIIYSSVQNGGSKKNVVLFHKSARVGDLDVPEGTEISAHLYEHSDEGVTPDYLVFESVPPVKEEKNDKDEFFSLSIHSPPQASHYGDVREPALRVDTASLRVHHVERVTFKTDDFKVNWHRTERNEKEDF